MYYAKWYCDHNIINAALETLTQLLKSPLKALASSLLSSQGIRYSRIASIDNETMLLLSELSTYNATTTYVENSGSTSNLVKSDMSKVKSIIKKWILESMAANPTIQNLQSHKHHSSDVIEMKGKILENYSGLQIGTSESKKKNIHIHII